MQTQTLSYTPQWHSQLLEYMKKVYPYRSCEYLDWWRLLPHIPLQVNPSFAERL